MDRRMRASRQQEQRGAEQHGGRVQPGSGSGRYQKGDVKTGTELIEYKRTDGRTITLKVADLVAIREKALVAGRDPLMGIEVGNRDYLIVATDDFDHLVERCAGEIARDIVQRRLGDARPTQSEIQPEAEVCRDGEQRERVVLSRAAPVPEGQRRSADDAATDGGAGKGLLPRTNRWPRVPSTARMSRMGNGELAEVRRVGRVIGAGAEQTSGTTRPRGRTSRLIGGNAE